MDNLEFDIDLAAVGINPVGDGLVCLINDPEGTLLCEPFKVENQAISEQITEINGVIVYLYVTYPYHVSFLLYTKVNKRGQTKKRSQNAFLCRTVKQLVDKKQTLILTTSDI